MTRIGQISPPASRFGSYSQWVREVIRSVKRDRNLLVALFESSVPEPVELLRELVSGAFSQGVSSRYVSAFADGNPFVLAALSQRLGVPEDHLLCTTGATGALSLIYRSLLVPGHRILVETPSFDLFHTIAASLDHGVDHFERRGPGFAIDPEDIRRALTPATRIILLSNLHNPSGAALDRETLAAIGTVAEAHGAVVIVDEVYADYAGADFVAATTDISPNFIRIGSLTKGWGLSTLRCGWIVAEPGLLAQMRALNQEVEFGVSKLAHAMAALVLEDAPRFDGWRDGIMRDARPIMEAYHAHWLAEGLVTGELPTHGCTTFARLTGIRHSEHFSEWLADRCGVVVAPGEYFGAPGHLRIGFAAPRAELDYGLQALTDGLKRYREIFPAKVEAAE
ncbi:pyridoxal phosphate-dependent aminotransferase [Sandaracinobacteroides hominis]|uniref:pyridoxal phosphate-dependent aminotransferase n=1 Tax=Sandaracinobacteroides hominis TaxID=2780086 RepID=UPI002E2D68F6|nr:pyridoxal phosphate-dependent aminotransferase [Sandaracinobacteroides hominis]